MAAPERAPIFEKSKMASSSYFFAACKPKRPPRGFISFFLFPSLISTCLRPGLFLERGPRRPLSRESLNRHMLKRATVRDGEESRQSVTPNGCLGHPPHAAQTGWLRPVPFIPSPLANWRVSIFMRLGFGAGGAAFECPPSHSLDCEGLLSCHRSEDSEPPDSFSPSSPCLPPKADSVSILWKNLRGGGEKRGTFIVLL